jgi:hypothetical protein
MSERKIEKHFTPEMLDDGCLLCSKSHAAPLPPVVGQKGERAMRFTYWMYGSGMAIAWLSLIASANAGCVAPGFNPSGKFCNGCRYQGQMGTSRDQVCERPYIPAASPGIPVVQIRGHRITQRAQHGIAGITATEMAYAPGKGYIGKDEFTVEVDYRQGTELTRVRVGV